MKTLVIGGTGTVGSNVVRELLARKAQVRVLTRDRKKAPEGVEVVVGDMTDPTTLGPAFEGMDGVFLLNAVSMTETHEGMMAVLAAKTAKVKRLVYLSVHHADRHPLIPHFASKLPIENAAKASGIPCTILRPNNFYQNDYWVKDVLVQHGAYPFPIGDQGCARVDARDIAEAAAIALTSDGHEGQTYNIVGPEAWNGEATARAWTQALGKPIAYAGNDVEAWGEATAGVMPGWMIYDFKTMFQVFVDHGLLATGDDLERLTKLLGHAPRTFEDFAKETARMWSATEAES